MRLPLLLLTLVLAVAIALSACRSGKSKGMADEVGPVPVNQSIVVAGERVHVGAPVVLWTEAKGYNAYSTSLHFGRAAEGVETPPEGKLRYKPGRSDAQGRLIVHTGQRDLLALQGAVDMFVIHYDVCGTSQQCFKVLHDRRALSVHFMIDVDGTIYQTLDVADTAWHAAQVNSRSIGVELAQIGSYALTDEAGLATLERWYPSDANGHYIKLPKNLGDPGFRDGGFVGRPARPDRIVGPQQGHMRAQYDFTPEQYDSLVKLSATLCKKLPRIQPDAPRDLAGRILTERMDAAQEKAFQGIVGHHHVSKDKQDPGPAFDWEVFLARVKARVEASTIAK